MKSTTKLTIKLFLIASLFVSAALADDGHMPGGDGYSGNSNNSVCVTDDGHMPGGDSADDGHMPGGDSADDGHMPGGDGVTSSNCSTSEDSILKFVKNYLYSMFG